MHYLQSSHAAAPATTSSPCGITTTAPTGYDHVIWILEENHDLNDTQPTATPDGNGVLGNKNAPYLNTLMSECGYTTAYADDLPTKSEPHYLASISGSNCDTGFNATGTGCIVDDNPPSAHTLSTVSLFEQLTNAGKTWKSYQEGASGNCVGSIPKHDAAVFYTRIASTCKTNDVPIPNWTSGTPTGALANDIANDTLPNFAYVTPNETNDMHVATGGKVGTGSAWLAAYLPLIFASNTYKAGRTAVMIVWDETYPGSTSPLPNVVIAPSVPAKAVSTAYNGVSLLTTTQALLGITTPLGCTSGTPPGKVGSCPSNSTVNFASAYNLIGSGSTDNPPTATLTAPAAGNVSNTSVSLTATATDDHAVASVSFSYKLHTATSWTTIGSPVTSSPYAATWNTSGLTSGAQYDVRAIATDSAGQQSTPSSVSVTIATTPPPPPGNGDANGDGRVNAIDLSILLSHDGQNYPPADFNHDGTVGAADLAILLGHWTW